LVSPKDSLRSSEGKEETDEFDILAACISGTLLLGNHGTRKRRFESLRGARVIVSSGKLKAGRILVSNFNNSASLQGTGTTIVDISPEGGVSQFAQISAASLRKLVQAESD
jgi:hypothetical protein